MRTGTGQATFIPSLHLH